jgi:hypothetical protein
MERAARQGARQGPRIAGASGVSRRDLRTGRRSTLSCLRALCAPKAELEITKSRLRVDLIDGQQAGGVIRRVVQQLSPSDPQWAVPAPPAEQLGGSAEQVPPTQYGVASEHAVPALVQAPERQFWGWAPLHATSPVAHPASISIAPPSRGATDAVPLHPACNGPSPAMATRWMRASPAESPLLRRFIEEPLKQPTCRLACDIKAARRSSRGGHSVPTAIRVSSRRRREGRPTGADASGRAGHVIVFAEARKSRPQ